MPCVATDHQLRRKVNARVAMVSVPFVQSVPARIVLTLITPDETVPRLRHTTMAAMAREVREVKAKAKARRSIVSSVRRT